jgi:hypothetical protein
MVGFQFCMNNILTAETIDKVGDMQINWQIWTLESLQIFPTILGKNITSIFQKESMLHGIQRDVPLQQELDHGTSVLTFQSYKN